VASFLFWTLWACLASYCFITVIAALLVFGSDLDRKLASRLHKVQVSADVVAPSPRAYQYRGQAATDLKDLCL